MPKQACLLKESVYQMLLVELARLMCTSFLGNACKQKTGWVTDVGTCEKLTDMSLNWAMPDCRASIATTSSRRHLPATTCLWVSACWRSSTRCSESATWGIWMKLCLPQPWQAQRCRWLTTASKLSREAELGQPSNTGLTPAVWSRPGVELLDCDLWSDNSDYNRLRVLPRTRLRTARILTGRLRYVQTEFWGLHDIQYDFWQHTWAPLRSFTLFRLKEECYASSRCLLPLLKILEIDVHVLSMSLQRMQFWDNSNASLCVAAAFIII